MMKNSTTRIANGNTDPQGSSSLGSRISIMRPLQPPKPQDWTWTCDKCQCNYKVGVVRVCPECRTYFRPNLRQPLTNSARTLVPRVLPKDDEAPVPYVKRIILKRIHDQKKADIVSQNFDHKTWALQNTWRKMERLRDASSKPENTEIESAQPNNDHDCLINCDFPGQCCQKRMIEQQQLELERLKQKRLWLERLEEDRPRLKRPWQRQLKQRRLEKIQLEQKRLEREAQEKMAGMVIEDDLDDDANSDDAVMFDDDESLMWPMEMDTSE